VGGQLWVTASGFKRKKLRALRKTNGRQSVANSAQVDSDARHLRSPALPLQGERGAPIMRRKVVALTLPLLAAVVVASPTSGAGRE
jgi:hypothetical protein